MAPLARYEGFLLLIGSVFAPLFGVLLADHFIVRRRRIEPSAITAKGGAYWFSAGWHLRGLAAWAVGICVYQAITRYQPSLGATLPAFAVAAVAYLALRVFRSRGSFL